MNVVFELYNNARDSVILVMTYREHNLIETNNEIIKTKNRE